MHYMQSVVSASSSNGHVDHRYKHGRHNSPCIVKNDESFAGLRCRVSAHCFIICKLAHCNS